MVNKWVIMKLEGLEIYKLAVEIFGIAWKIYEKFDWHDQKIDSMRANITEGFGGYHYLDKNKFNYNYINSAKKQKQLIT